MISETSFHVQTKCGTRHWNKATVGVSRISLRHVKKHPSWTNTCSSGLIA